MTSVSNVFRDFFDTKEDRNKLTMFLAFLIAIVLYHATVFWVILQDDIDSQFEFQSFTIGFEEQSTTSEESRVINDGEVATLQYIVGDEVFSSHNGFGMLFLTISYTETSGEFADPCDTVSVDLIPTGATAVWDDERNDLSAISSDCETMSLALYVFPEYNSTTQQVTGGEEKGWVDYWTDDSHGKGTFSLEVEVIVNEPTSALVPTISDNEETIVVTWEAVFFDVDVTPVK